MRVEISKSQWEQAGKKAGWNKKEAGLTLNGILQQYPDVAKQYETVRTSVPFLKKLLAQYNINWQQIPELLELLG